MPFSILSLQHLHLERLDFAGSTEKVRGIIRVAAGDLDYFDDSQSFAVRVKKT